MNKLVIGIPTYKRPKMLEKLVRSIYNNPINKQLISSVELIVVDNDVEESASEIATTLKNECPDNYNVNYHNYSIKGLSFVRNEIMNLAFKHSPDYIIFIDDDIFTTPSWLESIVQKAIDTNSDMVLGPCKPVFEEEVSRYISPWFDYGKFNEGEQLNELYGTGNLLMRTAFLKEHNLTFDNRFNLSGGEDTYFGVQALSRNVKMIWSNKALTYETIPPVKANLNWLTKRWYRSAGTYTYILKLRKEYGLLIKKFIISLLYLSVGTITLPLTLIPFKKRYWSILKIAEGLGGLAGMANIRYKEYS